MPFPQDYQLGAHDFRGFPEDLLRLDYVSPFDGLPDWALLLPSAPRQRCWAVVIHGHGSKGNQLFLRPDIRQNWLPELQERGFGILSPNLRGNAWMSPAAVQDLDALLNFLRKQFAAEQFIFTSGSMGGSSNLMYAALRPDNVSAVIARGAICDLAAYHAFCRLSPNSPGAEAYDGAELQRTLAIRQDIADSIEQHYGGKPEEKPELYRAHSPLFQAEQLLKTPIYLSHGTLDALMPVSQPRKLLAALAEHQALAYVEIPGGNHDSPLSFGLDRNRSDFPNLNFSALDWVLQKANLNRSLADY